MQTATLATFALAVAGAAYAAGADSNHAVKGKAMNGGSAPAAAPAPEPRTVTVTTTVNGAGANQASFAAAALAGALAFASYMLAKGLGVDLEKGDIAIKKVSVALAVVAIFSAYSLSLV
ncbi:hypothetical protein LPJ64_001931 [Coemansia asiatica]|uniref:Uncharacterized protein n=1 Tax=Coemansia asiatica TaxID=1052880 RepID=A0A9W8CLJ2_9FUNG|nr:hypothetical protein LPJ64_001931 [Coemansia asiatica]